MFGFFEKTPQQPLGTTTAIFNLKKWPSGYLKTPTPIFRLFGTSRAYLDQNPKVDRPQIEKV